ASAERISAARVVGGEDLASGADIRDVGQRFVAETVLRDDAGAGLRVQLAVEALRERDLLGVGELLVVEDEHGVLVHSGADRGERPFVERLAQRDRARFAEEARIARVSRPCRSAIGLAARKNPVCGRRKVTAAMALATRRSARRS